MNELYLEHCIQLLTANQFIIQGHTDPTLGRVTSTYGLKVFIQFRGMECGPTDPKLIEGYQLDMIHMATKFDNPWQPFTCYGSETKSDPQKYGHSHVVM